MPFKMLPGPSCIWCDEIPVWRCVYCKRMMCQEHYQAHHSQSGGELACYVNTSEKLLTHRVPRPGSQYPEKQNLGGSNRY